MPTQPDQLVLDAQRVITVRALATVNGLACEAKVSDTDMTWQFVLLRTDGEPVFMFAHQCEHMAYSPLLRMPEFRDHPVPTNRRELHRFVRWFLSERANLSGR